MSIDPGLVESPRYRTVTQRNFRDLAQINRLTDAQRFAIDVVGSVLPFRVNNYVCEHLIDWDRVPDDPIFRLTFPQEGMLQASHFATMADLIRADAGQDALRAAADAIRWQLQPHPAGQLEHNLPNLDGDLLKGIQHKYAETVLFFPSQGQTCHAYCTFCFRWPQFVGIESLKFAMRETDKLVAYLRSQPQVTDLLFTGGDPLIMKTRTLAGYVDGLLSAEIDHLQTIRIGTKALSFWPYRFTSDSDADELLRLFERIVKAGKHLTIMAHVNHPNEWTTPVVADAIARIRSTGAEIRTQSPLLRHINDDAAVWATMWRQQVALGCVPYYMFVARDTGAQHYFAVPLVEAWQIFQGAYQNVSGLARTVRGPSMSAHPGKVEVVGVVELQGERQLALRFLQGRNPDWVLRPFFAAYDDQAIWLDQLKPANGATSFFWQNTDTPAHTAEAFMLPTI